MSLSGQVSEGLEVVTTWRKEDTEEEEEFCVRVQRGEGSSEELCARAIKYRFVRTGRGTALMLTSDPWL